ncbi:xylulokinase [Maricaulis sp. D1M11]|uniref:xylulokinase n=1 Tax=Maricaulis sp. D1M11 TaxID=3076117 RepID=UPI0039B5BFEC
MYLGIDIGTSAVKAMIIDDTNTIKGQTAAPLAVQRPQRLWSEQNPKDWWEATNTAVSQLDADLRHQVQCIGLSGQMHGATLLDTSDTPLRPAILWNDGRSFAECEALKTACPAIEDITGNLVMPGFTAPKLLWLKTHEPELFDKIHKVLLPKDYVRLRMTGEYGSDMSDAAGTSWLDVAARDWSDTALDATGLSRSAMPDLYEGPETTGKLRAELAEAWGMQRVNVVAGGGDNAAGAAGVGVINEGDALLSLGTSGVIFLAGSAFRPHPGRAVHAFCHALPQRWHQMTVMLSAASCVDWAVQLTGQAGPAELVSLAEQEGGLDVPEIFLPYLSGERTPHNNPQARGVVFGMDHDTNPARISQAVLEGVAFAFADGLSALIESGSTVNTLSVIGGGSRSRYWGRLLAAALKRPMIFRSGSEFGPAFGAAKLARLGHEDGDSDTILAPPPIVDIIEPRDADMSTLAPKYERFKSLYSSLSCEFKGQ